MVDQLPTFWRYEGFVPPGSQGTDVRRAFALALIAHGLPNSAIALLDPLTRDAGDPAHDQMIDLLAEAYLAANRAAESLDLLRTAAVEASEPRPGRNLLAARALAALGRFAEAAGVLHGSTGGEDAPLHADYLWKAGLWQEASRAYRELQASRQDQADPESAVRLAAAAYMAGEPPGRLHNPAGNAEGAPPSAFAAFAPLPRPDGTASGTVAAQLLDQAAGLSALAERYGLGDTQTP